MKNEKTNDKVDELDAVAKAKAEIKAEAEARVKAEAEIRAEAEAKLIAEAKVREEAYANATWDEEPEKDMTRVFRVLKPPTKKLLITLQAVERIIDGVKTPAPAASIPVNSSQQYVLLHGAIDYKMQLAALRDHQRRGFIEEVDPAKINVPWIPPEQVKLAEAEALVKKLKALV